MNFFILTILIILVICFTIKVYFRLTNGICHSNKDLSGKVIVITGGNTGIGREYVLDMVKRNAIIIMACRNVKTAMDCIDWVKRQTNNNQQPKIFVEHCDLASLKSVTEFCKRLRSKKDNLKIDFLVCFAAATGAIPSMYTPDGFEIHFQCNYLSHFLMIHLLFDMLNDNGRIILTSSHAHTFGTIDLDNISRFQKYEKHLFRSYSDSKLALVMLAKELTNRLSTSTKSNITANAFHPGTVLTNGISNIKLWYLRILLTIVAFFYGKSHKDGAQTMIYLTVSDEISGYSGYYFADCAIASYNRLVDDEQLRQKLWNLSYDLIKPYLDNEINHRLLPSEYC